MELVVLVSVLSTLGIVGLFSSILILRMNLKNKVDKELFEGEIRSLYSLFSDIERNNRISEERMSNQISRYYDDLYSQFKNTCEKHKEKK
jgi:hypothetical protein